MIIYFVRAYKPSFWLNILSCKLKAQIKSLVLIVLAILLFICASFSLSGWQYIITSMLVGSLILGYVLPYLYLNDITIKKKIPSKMQVDKQSLIHITLINTSNIVKHYLNVNDFPLGEINKPFNSGKNTNAFDINSKNSILEKSPIGEKMEYFIKTVCAKDSVDIEYTYSPSKRGIHNSGSVDVSTSSPFGMFILRKNFNNNEEVIIYPKVLEIRGGWLNRIDGRQVCTEISRNYILTNIASITRNLREYIPGDSPRTVHWPTSAKANNLYVREFEIETTGNINIMFDSSYQFENEYYYELAVTTVATLLNSCHKQNLTTRFITQQEAISTDLFYNDTDWNSQLEVLARIKPVGDKDLLKLTEDAMCRVPQQNNKYNPLYVIISNNYKTNELLVFKKILYISVCSRVDKQAEHTIITENDLRYI